MVGRSNEISRENCRVQVADDKSSSSQRGTLRQQWPRPFGGISLAERERTSDIGNVG
jgi:hypothetical protein